MKPITIFVTYNPSNSFEQTLAIRLHTIGAVNGYRMFLPDRFNDAEKINQETVYRIKSSDYFILFSTSSLTETVKQEIKTAFDHLKEKSKIIIIYNKVKNISHNQNCTEVYIDTQKDSTKVILDKVLNQISLNEKKNRNRAPSKTSSTADAIGGLILVGLGLLTLDAIFNKD
jgi:hypothetical protein